MQQAGDGGPDPLGDPEGVDRPGLRQQQGELLAAEPAGQVVLAQHRLQRVRDLLEHLVAGQVPVGVVDHLEPVDVEQRHRQLGPGPHRPGHLRRRAALPGRRVQQAGLGVGPRVLQQPGVPHGPLQQGDEGEREDEGDPAVGHAERDQHGHAQLADVVVHRLLGELLVAQPDVRVRALDRGQDQDLVDDPLHDRADRHDRHPGQRVAGRVRGGTGHQVDEEPEDEGSGDVAQPDGGRAEHAPVHRSAPDPPLGQGEADRREGAARRRAAAASRPAVPRPRTRP